MVGEVVEIDGAIMAEEGLKPVVYILQVVHISCPPRSQTQ